MIDADEGKGTTTMYEGQKLEEARYHYERMVAEAAQGDRAGFNHSLNAFLASARSVLQYALKEAKATHGACGQRWYDAAVTASTVLKFFKDKRDLTIHEKPVRPLARHAIALGASVSPAASIEFVVRDKDGNVKQRGGSSAAQAATQEPALSAYGRAYHFDDWGGKDDDDVPKLCDKYLHQLEALVRDGIQRDYLTVVVE